MADDGNWQRLLRESLAVLALPHDEQVRVNGPGCATCDMFEGFCHARSFALESGGEIISGAQRNLLDRIDVAMHMRQDLDNQCFNPDALERPIWQQLRELAAEALHAFGWEGTAVQPFVEIEPGVWHRPAIDA